MYDPVSINASESTCLNLGESSVNFGDDKISQYQYVKRLQYIGNKNYGGHFAMTKMKMTSSGIIIKRSSHQEKKSKIFARLNYKGGLPESNVLKRWEVSRDKGFLWTKFDKQERVKVWSKSQIVSLVTDDSVSNSILIDKISSMNIRLGDLVLLLDLPIELRNWSNEEILYYMQNGVDIFRMKIILVGPANSGKTALVKKLAASNPNSKLSKYENIITADCVMSDILFSIWDLGDVKTYSNMHSLFFDPKALYLFVWNPLVGDVADIEIHINSIRNCAPEAAIVVVCTHSDERSMPLDGSTLQELDDKFGNIWGCAHVGLRTNDGLVHLMEDLVRIASEQPSVHQKIPEKFVLLQDALGCEISERNKFSIQKEEFFVLATSVVGLNKASSERALELLKYWGNLFALSEEVLILQPPRLAEVFARLFTPAARTCVDRDPLMAGILYHSENVLESIWTGFDAKLYEHFLNLLYTNDMAYLVRGKDGKPFYGHGVSIIPELLTNGATESYEHFIRSSIFPEDTPFLSTLSIKFNTVSSSYFSKLHCRCGFAVLLGSSWKYGFAIEVKGCRSKASDLERFLSEHKSSYALVCMRPRHQTVDIYSFGDGFSACSLVLHAMIALRESSFPFMELKEAAVVDCNKIRVGLNQYFDSNNEKDYNFAAADKIIAFELNMLRGHKIERSDEHDSVWDRTLSTNTSLVDDIKNLGFGKRGRNDSEASVMSSIMAPRQDNGRREDKEVDENAGSNALTLCGDELFVSNDMKNLFDFIDLISNSPDEISVNLINLDIRLSFCVKELMSYTCTRGNHLKYAETCAMWVAYRTDDSGEIGNNNDYVTLCPISPSHRAGHFWDLMRHLRVTIPKAQLQEADGGALKGLSDYIRKALRHLLDDESRFILRDDIWIGFGDFSIILTQLARHEEKMFENLSRPPYRKPIFMSISSAEKLRFLPHVASERLLDVVMNSHGFYELNLPYNGSLIEKDPLYKLLYDFVNNEEVGEFKKAPLEGRERPILKSTSDEFSSFDAAQDLSLTASKSLMARLIGYGKIRIGYNYGMQHREFPTTIGFVDSSLLKQSLLSLSSTKSYARLAALRRYYLALFTNYEFIYV